MASSKEETPSGAQTPLKAASDTEVGVVGNISDDESGKFLSLQHCLLEEKLPHLIPFR